MKNKVFIKRNITLAIQKESAVLNKCAWRNLVY